MSIHRDALRERVESYVRRYPDASLPQILGRFTLNPDDSEARAVVNDVLTAANTPHDDAEATEVEA